MSLVLRWLASAGALLLVAYFVPGIAVAGFVAALLAALVIGLVSAVIGPVLKTLALPLTCLTLGLFSLVINAALFGLAAWLVPGFAVDGAVAALIGSVAYGLLTALFNAMLGRE